MGFPDDTKKNIYGAECERKQGNDEGRHCNKEEEGEGKSRSGGGGGGEDSSGG